MFWIYLLTGKHKKKHSGIKIIKAERISELFHFRPCACFSCRSLFSFFFFSFPKRSSRFHFQTSVSLGIWALSGSTHMELSEVFIVILIGRKRIWFWCYQKGKCYQGFNLILRPVVAVVIKGLAITVFVAWQLSLKCLGSALEEVLLGMEVLLCHQLDTEEEQGNASLKWM